MIQDLTLLCPYCGMPFIVVDYVNHLPVCVKKKGWRQLLALARARKASEKNARKEVKP